MLLNILIDSLTLNIIYAVSGLVVLLLLIGVFYFGVFGRIRLKKQINDICSRFEKSHGLLFGQDSQYIRRLETISSMNLTYVKDYNEWNKRYKDVRDVSDASAQASINNLKDMLSDGRRKEMKAAIPGAREIVESYCNEVTTLDKALKSKFQDEECCKSAIFELKEKFRRIKNDYYSKQTDIGLVSDTFDKVFEKLDSLFVQSDAYIDDAQYIEAKNLMDGQISPVLTRLSKLLQVLPNICITLSNILPDKIELLTSRYEEMIRQGYPLHHLMGPDDLKSMKREIEAVTGRVKGFNMASAEDDIDKLTARIEGLLQGFGTEVEARKAFESGCDSVYKADSKISNDFIQLNHAMPSIKKVFAISKSEQERFDAINNLVNSTGATKRLLDTYVHSATKQPFSVLLAKMKNLGDQSKEAAESIASFKTYLSSLKTDSELAHQAIFDYYSRLKEAEGVVRSFHNEALEEKYEPLLDEAFATLDYMEADLKKEEGHPIDVEKVNEGLALLHSKHEATITSILKDAADSKKAEATIVLANRSRGNDPVVNGKLSQSEALFQKGDFARSLSVAESTKKPVETE